MFGAGGFGDGLEGLLGGGGAGGILEQLGGNLDKLWDMPMITSIAFHPRPAEPAYLGATSGQFRDGTFDVSGGAKVSYRLYLPPGEQEVQVVVYNFHGNAEICTDISMVSDLFHQSGAALLSIDYRGFSWGSGQPSLTKLCNDADDCFRQSGAILAATGCKDAKRVAMGRSIGAVCAVHLAAHHAAEVNGLVIDSGLMALKEIPIVEMMAPQVLGPNSAQLFQQLKEPFDNYGKLSRIGCPVLVMHGMRDEIVPYAQGVRCHERCVSPDKKLRTWESAGHNDVNAMYGSEWWKEIDELIGKARAFDNLFPAGALVEAHSLSAPTFNGLQASVLGPQGDRTRVQFPEPHGEKALKADNLKIIDRAPNPFPEGAVVEIHSLGTTTILNGVRGHVLGLQGDRVRVALPEPHGEKSLRPANLKVVDTVGTTADVAPL